MPRNKTQSILYGLHYARTVRVFCKVKGVCRSYIYILAAMIILSNRGKKLKKTSIYLLMFYNGFFKDYTSYKNNFDAMIERGIIAKNNESKCYYLTLTGNALIAQFNAYYKRIVKKSFLINKRLNELP